MPRQIGNFLARTEYLPLVALTRALGTLPLATALKIGAGLGAILMHLDRFNRPIALKNLEIAFPGANPDARLSILDGMYRNWGRMLAEWAHFDELNRDNIEHFADYDELGRETLKWIDERATIVVTAHFGNFELLPLAHSIYGRRIAIIQRPLRNPLVDQAVRRLRSKFGNELIARKKAGRTMLRLLREREKIALALDLDVRHGVFVDFFGLKACTSEAPARLAMLTGAPVVPVFMVREGATARHRIAVLPAVEIVKTADRQESVRENTQRMTAVIESMVRRYPDHWNWIHRRWKTRPPGEARFY